MSQNFERAIIRLRNIQAIEPLLGALRTISMGAWQSAKNKIADIQRFEENFNHIFIEVLPEIEKVRAPAQKDPQNKQSAASTVFLIVGSERGLCGKFNKILANQSLDWIESQHGNADQIWVLGSRMVKELSLKHVEIAWQKPLDSRNFASYTQAYYTTQTWIDQFESYAFDRLIILYNQLNTGTNYQFTTQQLIPFSFHPSRVTSETDKKWPPPIIETKPLGIYNRIIQHFIASSFYKTLLSSGIAEHSTRYNLMQEAKENAEDIIEELNSVINLERKRKITQQMQEQAAGSGLLDKP